MRRFGADGAVWTTRTRQDASRAPITCSEVGFLFDVALAPALYCGYQRYIVLFYLALLLRTDPASLIRLKVAFCAPSEDIQRLCGSEPPGA